MDNQLDTLLQLSLRDDILRDLLDNEIILIGGGEVITNYN